MQQDFNIFLYIPMQTREIVMKEKVSSTWSKIGSGLLGLVALIFIYNLFFIIILLLPLWLFMVENNYQFILKYSKTVLIVIFIYFIFENITRLDWYMKRYDVWPPISKGELLERKNI